MKQSVASKPFHVKHVRNPLGSTARKFATGTPRRNSGLIAEHGGSTRVPVFFVKAPEPPRVEAGNRERANLLRGYEHPRTGRPHRLNQCTLRGCVPGIRPGPHRFPNRPFRMTALFAAPSKDSLSATNTGASSSSSHRSYIRPSNGHNPVVPQSCMKDEILARARQPSPSITTHGHVRRRSFGVTGHIHAEHEVVRPEQDQPQPGGLFFSDNHLVCDQ